MTNYDEMWTMMGKYTFEVDDQFALFVSCIICNKLLIDAHHGECGCKYCKQCIHKYLSDGLLFCPGATDDCVTRQLSLQNNIVRDIGANRNLSKMKVKCPSALCDHQCELAQMCHHLRMCDKKEICPFREMGCIVESMVNMEMSEHLSTEVHDHNKLMIQWMTNMSNDVTRRYQDKLMDCVQTMELKISQITEALQIQIIDLVGKNDDLRASARDLIAFSSRQENEILQLRDARDKQSTDICLLKRQVDRMQEESIGKVDNSSKARVSELLLPVATKHTSSIDQSKPKKTIPNPRIKIIASFVWKTTYLSNSKPQILTSGQFVSCDNEYQMNLTSRNEEDGSLLVTFQIDLTPPTAAEMSFWPCQCKVTMAIFNPSSSDVRQTKSQNCKFDMNQRSVTFIFSIDEVIKAGVTSQLLLQFMVSSPRPASSLMSVECTVHK